MWLKEVRKNGSLELDIVVGSMQKTCIATLLGCIDDYHVLTDLSYHIQTSACYCLFHIVFIYHISRQTRSIELDKLYNTYTYSRIARNFPTVIRVTEES